MWQTERRQLNVRRFKNIKEKKRKSEIESKRELLSHSRALCCLDKGPKMQGEIEKIYFSKSFKDDAKCRKSYQMLPKNIHTFLFVQRSNNLRKTKNNVQINIRRETCTVFSSVTDVLGSLGFSQYDAALIFRFFNKYVSYIWVNHKNASRFYLTPKSKENKNLLCLK